MLSVFDEQNKKFLDAMQRRIASMSKKAREKRLDILSANSTMSLAQTVEWVAITQSVTPHRAAEMVLLKMKSGKLHSTGVVVNKPKLQ